MGNMYETFRTDGDAEQNGIYIDYGSFRVKVARAGGTNKAYQRELERLSRPHRRAIATEMFENEQALALLRAAYARTVIKAWEVKTDDGWQSGIESRTGEVLPFNEANVLATFGELPDLFTDLMEQAGKAALFRASLREQAAGN